MFVITSDTKKEKATRKWPIPSLWIQLINSLDHAFDCLLRITEDHHGFIHIEEFVI